MQMNRYILRRSKKESTQWPSDSAVKIKGTEQVWSLSRNIKMEIGDRIFLLQTGDENYGFILSGYIVKATYNEGEKYFVKFRIDKKTDRNLDLREDEICHINSEISGEKIKNIDKIIILEEKWATHEGEVTEESLNIFSYNNKYYEGELLTQAKRQLRYRSRALRDLKIAKEIEKDGDLKCQVKNCGFSFKSKYGKIGEGYIEVHHKNPIANGTRNTGLDDLMIVCSNCHSMIHKMDDADVDQLIKDDKA